MKETELVPFGLKTFPAVCEVKLYEDYNLENTSS